MDAYPYMISNGKIAQILDKIKKAAEPQKFTVKFLQSIGFSSTNDRGIIPLLKKLGFINEDGTTTEKYKDLRDTTRYRFVLGQQIRELYSNLYIINTDIHNSSEEEIKGAMSRVTGKDETAVNRYYATFKTLTDIAEFDAVDIESNDKVPINKIDTHDDKFEKKEKKAQIVPNISPDFHYNIQIHLPATTDISVYNAIFRSIKENLM